MEHSCVSGTWQMFDFDFFFMAKDKNEKILSQVKLVSNK